MWPDGGARSIKYSIPSFLEIVRRRKVESIRSNQCCSDVGDEDIRLKVLALCPAGVVVRRV